VLFAANVVEGPAAVFQRTLDSPHWVLSTFTDGLRQLAAVHSRRESKAASQFRQLRNRPGAPPLARLCPCAQGGRPRTSTAACGLFLSRQLRSRPGGRSGQKSMSRNSRPRLPVRRSKCALAGLQGQHCLIDLLLVLHPETVTCQDPLDCQRNLLPGRLIAGAKYPCDLCDRHQADKSWFICRQCPVDDVIGSGRLNRIIGVR